MGRSTPGATLRAERQAETRQRVLDAAEQLFRAHGYGGTSLEEVARVAGYSKGAVYSNFDGKHDLFFAIVEAEFRELTDQLRRAVAAEPDPLGQLAAVSRWYSHFVRVEADWIRSLPELVAVATQDPAAHLRVTGLLREVEQALVELLERQQEVLGARFVLPPTSIAALAVSMVVGLTVRTVHGIDADDPADGPRLFDGAMAALLQLAPA